MKPTQLWNTLAVQGVSPVVRGPKRERAMRKVLAGLVLSAAMVAGAAAITTAPAQAAGIYVSVGDGYHHHHRHWRHHDRGHYWHNRYWQHRYWCDRHHRRWCYR